MLAVLNESFRCYPPVTSNLVRGVPPGGQTIAGHYVPVGTLVEVQQWSANHSTDNWADPWTFRPERFLDSEEEAAAKGNKFEALQPFSVGPRNCIGRNLAYAEMRLILARVLYDFDLELAPQSEGWLETQKAYSLWNKPPLEIKLTPVVGEKVKV
ncbi:Cytochrome monooxygenase 1 like protein [Verticillium longisporum]|nr:Cytochrome monooxygenase 1 like protein [Verticillium longisporum]